MSHSSSDPMSDDQRTPPAPALSAKEWGEVAAAEAGDYNSAPMIYTTYVGVAESPIPQTGRLHALAALALHGQTFGFTQEDVRLVEFVASFDPQNHPDVPKLRSLASRISALLPPPTDSPR